MIASSGRPMDLRIAGAMSTPRWQSWPMPASKPERGSSTPTFSGPLCARTIAGAAMAAAVTAAPASRRRRVVGSGVRVMANPP